MANGIEIRNPNGIISIDGSFKNYEVIDSFNVTTPNTWKYVTPYRPMPLIFYRPFNYGVEFYWNTAFDYLPTRPGAVPPFDTLDGYRLPVGNYVFTRAISSGTGSESYGIRVWNSSSNVVFDSGKKVANIDIMVLKTPTPEPPLASSWTQVISLPTVPIGIRYFLLNPLNLLASNYAYTYDPGDGSTPIDYYTSFILAGRLDNENQITYKTHVIENTTTAGGGWGLSNPSIPLVSGYINL